MTRPETNLRLARMIATNPTIAANVADVEEATRVVMTAHMAALRARTADELGPHSYKMRAIDRRLAAMPPRPVPARFSPPIVLAFAGVSLALALAIAAHLF